MQLTQRILGATLLTVAIAGGLAACGDDGNGDNGAATTAPVETEPTETTPTVSTPDGSTPAGSTPDGTAGEDLPTEESAEVLVGLSEDDATEAAEERGWTIRVVQRDGEDLPATMDLRPDRVNVEVTDGSVTSIASIG